MRRRLLVSLLAGLGIALAAAPVQANTIYGDVNVTITGAALSSPTLLLWEFTFGIGPSATTTSTPAGVTARTGPNVSWGSPTATVPNTVNGFYSGSSTVSIGNYNQFVAKTGSTLGADYNHVLFLNLVSPSANAIVFTLFDPPGPATTNTPLGIRIHGANNGPDLFDGSFLFGTDGSFSTIALSSAPGVTVTSQLVPEPSAAALLAAGLGALGLRSRRAPRRR